MRKRRGFTLIELLVAALILAVCLMGLASLWSFSFNMVMRHERTSMAYNLARRVVERTKQTGFGYYVAGSAYGDGTATFYYDASGGSESTTTFTGAAYRLTMTISSDSLQYSAISPFPPVGVASDALRTVNVSVVLIQTGEEYAHTGTTLARSGV